MKWSGTYNSPAKPDKYEVFLTSSTAIQAIRQFKAHFDQANLEFNKQRLVAVIRPPLPPSKFFGVAAGIILESGQTRFTYDEEIAGQLCRELYSKRKAPDLKSIIQDDIYRYENQPRAPGAPKYQFCKDL